MSTIIKISGQKTIRGTVKNLSASKSISNRVLILDALSGSQSELHNLSDANDTRLMRELLASGEPVLDVEDAGTTMRFLTAYCAVSGKSKTITGTERMQQRPIGILVDALRSIGANIGYAGREGYPPVIVKNFDQQLTNEISIRGDVSSQYISSLMMVAPSLPKGLKLNFEGAVTSRPYIEMTASLMKQFGATVEITDRFVSVPPQQYQPTSIHVESDWSAASYWFALAALTERAEITLPNITLRSLQGDSVIVDIMEVLGVKAEPRGNGLILQSKDHHREIEWDFTHCPDLAQTVAVVCTAKGIKGQFTGLQSLRIKETDRIAALQTELGKFGAQLIESDGVWKLIPPEKFVIASNTLINTYLDHRMAMAFAPLAALGDIQIENPDVVRKSYPRYWDDLKSFGFSIGLV